MPLCATNPPACNLRVRKVYALTKFPIYYPSGRRRIVRRCCVAFGSNFPPPRNNLPQLPVNSRNKQKCPARFLGASGIAMSNAGGYYAAGFRITFVQPDLRSSKFLYAPGASSSFSW